MNEILFSAGHSFKDGFLLAVRNMVKITKLPVFELGSE